MAGPLINIQIIADSAGAGVAIKNFFAGIEDQTKKIEAIGKSFEGIKSSIETAGHALEAYFGFESMKGFVEQAAEARQTFALLASAVQKSGQPVAEFTENLKAQREEFEKMSGLGDHVIADVQRMGLTMGIGSDDIKQFTKDAINLSTVMQSGPVEAAHQLGNAISGGTIMLRGQRIEIDNTLPKEEKLAQLYEVLRPRIEGAAAAANNSVPGLKAMGAAVEAIKEQLGDIIINTGVITLLNNIAQWTKDLGPMAKEAAVGVGFLFTTLAGLKLISPILVGVANALAKLGLIASVTDLAYLAKSAFTSWSAFGAAIGLAFGPLTVAIISITSLVEVIRAGAEAWKYWDAKKQEALALSNLEQRNQAYWNALNDAITQAGAAGKITLEQMRQMLASIQYIEKARSDGSMEGVTAAKLLLAEQQKLNELVGAQPQARKAADIASKPDLIAMAADSEAVKNAYQKGADEMLKLEAQNEDLLLKNSYERRTISDTQYFAARKLAIEKSLQEESDSIKSQITDLETERDKIANDPTKGQNSPDAITRAEAIKKVQELSVQIIDLQNRKKAAGAEADIKIAQNTIDIGKARDAQAARDLDTQNRSFEAKSRLIDLGASELEANWKLDDNQKQSGRLAFLQAAVDLDKEELATLTAQANVKGQSVEMQQKLSDEIAKTQDKLATDTSKRDIAAKLPDPGSVMDGLILKFHQVENATTTWAQKTAGIITNTVTSAIDGVSNALTSVIMGTKSAGQAFAEMGVQMLTSFIASVISAILWATIAIPILTAFGILSGGSTAAVGLGVVTASLAAAPKLASGGVITGPGGPTEDRVHVWASPGEGFLPYSAMQRIGPAAFEALRRGMIGAQELAQFIPAGMTRPISRSTFSGGGTATQDPFAGNVTVVPADIHIHEVRNRQDILDIMASREGQHVIISHVAKHKAQLGVRA
jgi:hypothetical protein